MKSEDQPARDRVRGVRAPAPRLTRTAAFLIATVLSVPVFLILMLAQWSLS